MNFINEKQFRKLRDELNGILIESNSKERISIPWLHLIRAHPIFLNRYLNLYSKKNPLNFFSKIYYFFLQKITWFYILFGSFFRTNKNSWFGYDELPKNIDYLFYSFIGNPNQFQNKDDFYFGKIPSALQQNNKKVVVAITCLFKNRVKHFKNYFKKKSYAQVYFSKFLSVKQEIKIHGLLKKESNILKRESSLVNEVFKNQILNIASKKALLFGSHSNLRLYFQFIKLLKKTKPKVVVLLFEGHAYERLILSAIRKTFPKTVCISYQHSGVFKFSNSIKLKLKKEFNPDIILSSGINGKNEFEKEIGLRKIIKGVLGSSRGIVNSKYTIKKTEDNYTCLVIPEGLVNECISLFTFSLKCAKASPNIKFIWRLHPLITFDQLKSKSNIFINLPSNIILSTNSIENDIEISKWILYRGSSAVFKGISFGLRPLYFNIRNQICIDPLYKLNDFKVSLNNVKEFIETTSHDIKKNFRFHNKYLNNNISFCKNNFGEIDISVFDKVLNNKLQKL